MVKRSVEWKTYLIIGIITFIFFLSGIMTGIFLSKTKVDTLVEQVDQFRTNIRETETMMLFMSLYGKEACDMIYGQLDALGKESEEIRKEVAFYETTEKLEDPSYLSLKKDYMSVMLMHWLYQEKANIDCRMNSTIILFFYSNQRCEICKDEGTILTYLKQKYTNKIAIFTFDVDLDITMIDYLGKLYDFEIKENPVLIINGEKYEKFLNRNDIEKILCEKNETMC
jgi:thiol-disulfide isomerase/thioredoxin